MAQGDFETMSFTAFGDAPLEPPASIDRRRLLAGAAGGTLALLVTACAGYGPDSVELVRRLLLISTDRAFQRLASPDGFLGDQLVRLTPPELGGGRVLDDLLASPIIRDRLTRQMNYAASAAAEAVAPVVMDAARRLTIADAFAVLRGGPHAATDALEGAFAEELVARMNPLAANGLNRGDNAVIAEVLRIATGVNVDSLSRSVASQASAAIFRAIGREEAAIRADPRGIDDPALAAVLTGGSLLRR